MRLRLAAVIAGALLVAACTDTNSPVAPELLANRVADHGDGGATNPYFSWLPPVFDGFTGWRVANVQGLAPEVQIFACTATDGPACNTLGAQMADLPASDASGDEDWHESRDHYLATWQVDQDLAGDSYRLCVGLPQSGGGLTYLGHADVQVVNPQHGGRHGRSGRGRDGDWDDHGTTVVAGSTLPVKFKIGDGYQDATSDAGCPAAVTTTTVTLTGTDSLDMGFGVTYMGGLSVAVYDGAGNPVGDAAVTDANGKYTITFPGPTAQKTYNVCLETSLVGVFLETDPNSADGTTPPVCPPPAAGLLNYGHSVVVSPGDTDLAIGFGFALLW